MISIKGNCITVAAPTEVWAAPMLDASVAVVIFNRANISMEGTVEFSGKHSFSIIILFCFVLFVLFY
jgi:hypothetical protein